MRAAGASRAWYTSRMQWSDTGIVLSARKHGETSAIVHLLTAQHGRHAGLVRGGAGRRVRSVLQAGNEVQLTWRARLSDQLGTFTVELVRARAADVMHDAARLAAYTAATETVDAALPEREPEAASYTQFAALLDAIATAEDWPVTYARWELGLLAALGFGLEAVAASRVPLLAGQPAPADPRARQAAVLDALALTGGYLPQALAEHRTGLPARARLLERLGRANH